MSRTAYLFLCVMLCIPFGAGEALAVPACPAPLEITQPDGNRLDVFMRGDERQGWTETADGYTILQNRATGEWEYAVKDAQGDLALSGIVVRPHAAPPAAIEPHLMPRPNAVSPLRPRSAREGSSGPRFGNWPPQEVSGDKNLLVILVEFADRSLETTGIAWSDAAYSTEAGDKSAANFYDDNSFGDIVIEPIEHTQNDPGSGEPLPAGIIWATLATIDHPDCGGNIDYATEIEWINAALDVADDYIDFVALDADESGTLETTEAVIYFVVAGYEAACSFKTPSIWAHAWWPASPGDVTAGGVNVPGWALNGELYDDGVQLPMGVLTHELGHSMCDLPDLYDTSYHNAGIGVYSLMASGSWGLASTDTYPGTTPVSLDAWSRRYVGWSTPRIPTPGELSFGPALSAADAPVEMRNDSVSTDQYFLVENRYPTGWDEGMEDVLGADWGGGLLILHIDETIGTPANNDINRYVAGSHQGVIPDEASTEYGSVLDGFTQGHVTHLFYDDNNTQFDYTTDPNSNLYNDVPTYLGLGDVSTRAQTMTATFYISPVGTVETPTFDPDGGTFTSSVDVTVSCATSGATIRYTTTGVDPTATDATVASGGTIAVAQSLTLKAKAWKEGWDASAVKSAAYTVQVATPAFDPDGGSFTTAPQEITVSCATSGATIRYTTDGDDPTETDPTVASGGKVSISVNTTLKAKAFKTGLTPSEVKSAVYVFAVETPTFDPDGGRFDSATDVTVSCATPGATIHYTTSGVDPTETDPTVASGGTVNVAETLTLKAKALKTGWTGSAVKSASYVIKARPHFDIDGDESDDIVGLAVNGAIWYTTDNAVWTNVPGHLASMVVGDFDGEDDDDFGGLSANGSIWWYDTTAEGWTHVAGYLSAMAAGDLDGSGSDDIAGLSTGGSVWYTTDKSTWTNIPSFLSTVMAADLDGDVCDDVFGLIASGMIWYTTDLGSWRSLPKYLSKVSAGDFDGDGSDDIAGLSGNGSIWYTVDKATWTQVPGHLTALAAGNFDGDGYDDVVGINSAGAIWYTTDKATWTQIPGRLSSLAVGDLNGDGSDDIAGLSLSGAIWYTTDKAVWTNVPGSLASLYSAR